jgi:hypothetical protein
MRAKFFVCQKRAFATLANLERHTARISEIAEKQSQILTGNCRAVI